jgi:hypothetical protein
MACGWLTQVPESVENGEVTGARLLLDRTTQAWVRATGVRVDLDEHPWLDGPVGNTTRVAEEWIPHEARRIGADVLNGGGLLADLDTLASDTFDPSRLAPEVVDFYEHTARWSLEVSSQWSPIALPGAWLLTTLFSKRLQQLALPIRDRDVAQGMDSQVRVLRVDGVQVGAAWLRTLRSNGAVMYSGWYDACVLPAQRSASIRVTFPLPNGRLCVFLRPSVDRDGALCLSSPITKFGDDGAYLVVCTGERVAKVRRVPLAEQFRVYLDDDGILRTDHQLSLWSWRVLNLDYRLEPHADGTRT